MSVFFYVFLKIFLNFLCSRTQYRNLYVLITILPPFSTQDQKNAEILLKTCLRNWDVNIEDLFLVILDMFDIILFYFERKDGDLLLI